MDYIKMSNGSRYRGAVSSITAKYGYVTVEKCEKLVQGYDGDLDVQVSGSPEWMRLRDREGVMLFIANIQSIERNVHD